MTEEYEDEYYDYEDEETFDENDMNVSNMSFG